MDNLLKRAQGLYMDRQRIALAAILVVFSITFVLFYSNGIHEIGNVPADWIPAGWGQGIEVIASFNTVGFFLAFSVMVFFYAFWSWAFMPSPAAAYTMGVLRGVFGPKAKITTSIGRRFRVSLSDDEFIDIRCRVKEQGSNNWFVYKFTSHKMSSTNLEEIALRHGMSAKEGRFTTWISHDELHHRSILFAKAIAIAR